MKTLLQKIEEKLKESNPRATLLNSELYLNENDIKALIPQILELIKEEIEKKSWDERGKNRDEDKLITFKDIKSLLS